jgi:hypothetical protein
MNNSSSSSSNNNSCSSCSGSSKSYSSSSRSNIITSFNRSERDSTVMNSKEFYATCDFEFKKLNYEYELILA